MKSVITASTIFILIIVLISVSAWYVNGFLDEMLQYLYKNEKFVAENDWDSALNQVEKIESMWNQRRNVMTILFDHSYIDKMDESIANLKNTLQNREKSDYFYEKTNFYLSLLNLREQQKISIGNIL